MISAPSLSPLTLNEYHIRSFSIALHNETIPDEGTMICTLVANSMNKQRNAIGSDFNNSFWICLLFSNPLMRLDSLLQEHNATGYECCDYYSSAALGKRRPRLDFLLRVIRICFLWYPRYIVIRFRGHQFIFWKYISVWKKTGRGFSSRCDFGHLWLEHVIA